MVPGRRCGNVVPWRKQQRWRRCRPPPCTDGLATQQIGLSGGIENIDLTDDKGAEHLTRFAWQKGDIALLRHCVRLSKREAIWSFVSAGIPGGC